MYGSPIWTLAGVVAGALREQPRRGRLDDRAAHAAREADALAGDVGAGAAEDLGRLGEVDDLDADLFEERVGVGLDLLEALGRDDLDRGERAGQVRDGVHVARQALGLARGPAAPDRRVFEVRDSHRVSFVRRPRSARSCRRPWYGDADGSEAAGELAPLVERQAGAPRGDASPIWWNAMPRAARSRGERVDDDGGLGDDQRVGVELGQLAGQRRADERHAVAPGEDR